MTPKRSRRESSNGKRKIEHYTHAGETRASTPVGLVTPETDRDAGNKTYAYDSHIDPTLQREGKDEHTSPRIPATSRIFSPSMLQSPKTVSGSNAS